MARASATASASMAIACGAGVSPLPELGQGVGAIVAPLSQPPWLSKSIRRMQWVRGGGGGGEFRILEVLRLNLFGHRTRGVRISISNRPQVRTRRQLGCAWISKDVGRLRQCRGHIRRKQRRHRSGHCEGERRREAEVVAEHTPCFRRGPLRLCTYPAAAAGGTRPRGARTGGGAGLCW